MKFLLFLLVVFVAYTANAVPINDSPQTPYSRYIKYTDDTGALHTIDLEDDLNELPADIAAGNVYILLTRDNQGNGQTLEIDNADSVRNSNFDPSRQTVVIAHGWLGNEEANVNDLVAAALLAANDVNVIVLDWRHVARRNYVTAVRGVPEVGRGLGRFLRFLNSVTGASYGNTHLVGFSLGAHLVGNAGRVLDGQIARITALDPAGPLWNFNSNRVNADDARYVEGIHTDGGLTDISLGLGLAVGDVDFFPNGGSEQPGCLTPICNHNRAVRLFAASITHNHLVGRQCSGLIQVNLNLCRGAELNLGNTDLTKNGSGLYRVNTGWRYPF